MLHQETFFSFNLIAFTFEFVFCKKKKFYLFYRTLNLGNKILEKLETSGNFTRNAILLKAFLLVQLIGYEISKRDPSKRRP